MRSQHRERGSWERLEESAERLLFEVDGGGGVAVWTRAWQPTWRARAGGRRLDTVVVDGALLGIEVPPGKHLIEVDVDQRPVMIAGVAAFFALLLLLVASVRGGRSGPFSGGSGDQQGLDEASELA